MHKSWYKKWWGILLIIFGTLILIIAIASGFYIFDIVKKINSGENISQKILLSPSTLEGEGWGEVINGEDNYWIGSAKPKITIVEFADFSCAYCESAFTTIREIGLNYKNDVKIIFRDYPMQEHSLDLAMAGRCAGEQGLFWLMHDKLFANQGIYEKNDLLILASQIGADVNKFNSCITNKKYLAEIQKDFDDAQEFEITGTPTWFINGYKIAGDIPYDIFIQIIDELIKNYETN
ncbi:MAG: thioredoxin domain-containing protein [Candidatus Falkowbacteria bacterium]